MKKKADISMNVIVYAAIALLILVILVAFATGRLGGLFKGITQQTGEEIGTIRSACIKDCNLAKTTAESSGQSTWKISSYCKNTYAYDHDGDGETDSFHCYDDAIDVQCSVTLGSGDSAVLCNATGALCSC